MPRSLLLAGVLVISVIFYAGCKQPEESVGPRYSSEGPEPAAASQSPSYRFAVHPLYNPVKLSQVYQPLMDYLNNTVPDASFTLEASRDYAAFEKKIRQAKIEFLLPNPWQTLEAMEAGYDVIAMAGNPEDFRGIFITRKDSGLKHVTDLKGKTVSYPAPTALAGCVMPQYFLYQHGIDIHQDIHNTYVGSQESSIMHVFLGESAAGATWPSPWRLFQKKHPEKARYLQVQWQTESLLNNSVMARKDIAPELKHRLQKALYLLHETSSGRYILSTMETAKFHRADNSHYDVIRRFMEEFEQNVRGIREKEYGALDSVR
ncbi:phosphate/phosphite/phosphonate ABC transporter substrate-binding protein [Desulfogranum japonicum]|uniref:phosphate/phosphite/phosphonate ABC transporter substrate-binding protein n=1 Tax=Desulfogranum japonicum TaxID=231447 RepID=UPI00040C4437|nr:PhnD/SsuA/transferrin family substrate-binding protein [Desulfogranum japonicum]